MLTTIYHLFIIFFDLAFCELMLNRKNNLQYYVCITNHVTLQLTIRGGLYSIYIEDWLKIFHRDQLHFVHYESYVANRTEEIGKVIDFLGLGKIIHFLT